MEAKSVSDAISMTKKLIGSIRLPIEEKDNLDRLRVAYDNLTLIQNVMEEAEKEAAKKAEETAHPPEEEVTDE